MDHTIIKTDWLTHKTELSSIRTRVFMQEQAVSEADEWDGLDEQAIHFLVLAGDAPDQLPIGCARLLDETFGESARRFHIGRVALLEAYRGCGLGNQLMGFILDYCRLAAPGQQIYLHAQTERLGFYQQLGFTAVGDEFMDAGIAHFTMYYTPEDTQDG